MRKEISRRKWKEADVEDAWGLKRQPERRTPDEDKNEKLEQKVNLTDENLTKPNWPSEPNTGIPRNQEEEFKAFYLWIKVIC